MTVSSAMVLRFVLSDCGISAGYIVYSNGPKMLPCGHPSALEMGGGRNFFFVYCHKVSIL